MEIIPESQQSEERVRACKRKDQSGLSVAEEVELVTERDTRVLASQTIAGESPNRLLKQRDVFAGRVIGFTLYSIQLDQEVFEVHRTPRFTREAGTAVHRIASERYRSIERPAVHRASNGS